MIRNLAGDTLDHVIRVKSTVEDQDGVSVGSSGGGAVGVKHVGRRLRSDPL